MAQITKADEQKLKSCLESFMKQEDDLTDLNHVRESNASYRMDNNKYLCKRKPKDEMLQYATLYFLRLEKLRPLVKEAAEMKWKDLRSKNQSELKYVNNILDIRPFEDTVIIGTLFKEQKLKPTILNNIMGVLGQKKFLGADGKFKYGAFVNTEEEDVAVLEDKSGRITIKNSP